MASGKIFAISFAINAALGATFSTAMTRGSAVMQQLNEKTKLLNAEQKRLDSAWQDSQNQIRGYARQMQQLQMQYNQGKIYEGQYQSSMARIGQSMRTAGMSADEYRGHLARLRQEMEQTQNAAKRMQAAQAGKAAASANVSAAWAGLQTTAATAGMMAAPFIGAIETAANFEQAMSKVQAITRSDSDAMERLTQNARMLGETTQFSATQAAQAMSYLGMAGWDANQIIGGMPGLLALAAAGGTDLARTADIVSDGLTAFGLSADEAGQMADVFAVTATRTNTNVEMLGETMKYAAPVAKAFGASMKETAALAGIMANSGIKASQAGTALRAGFLRLAGPPKESANAMEALGISLTEATAQQQEAHAALRELEIEFEESSGKPKKMSAILGELRRKTADLSEEQRLATMQVIFGTEAATGWLAVLDSGPDTFDKLMAEIENCDGEAEKMAKTMTNNAKGSMIQLQSAMEGLAISLGTIFLPAITAGAKSMADMTGKASAWVKAHEEGVKTAVEIAGAVAAAIMAFKMYRLASASVDYVTSSLRLQYETLRNTAAGQRALAIATQASTKAMATMRAVASGDIFRGMATQAVNCYNQMRAITWGDVISGVSNSAGSGATVMKTRLGIMKEAAITNMTAAKNAFVNGGRAIRDNAINAGRAVLNMARNFSIANAANAASTALKGMGRAMLHLGRAGLAAMFSPLGVALMAIAGAAYLIYTNWDKVSPFFMQLWGQITAAFTSAWTMIQPAVDQLGAAFTTMINALGPTFSSLGENMGAAFASISAVVAANSGVFDVLIQAAQMLATLFGGALVGAFIVFANVVVGQVTAAISVVASVITGAIGVLSGLIQFITGVFTGDWMAAWNGVVSIFQSIFNMLGNIAGSVLGGIKNTVNGIISSIKSVAGWGGGGGSEVAANAKGGIYRKGAFLTTFAEESPEAAIPLDGSQRAVNLWQRAGEMLGISPVAGLGADAMQGRVPLDGAPRGLWQKAVDVLGLNPGGGLNAIKQNAPSVASPAITINLTVNGSTDTGTIKNAVLDAGRKVQRSFAEEMAEFRRNEGRLAY